MQLSCRTITRRNEDMSGNVTQQLEDHIQNCSFFSLQFDESTDDIDTARLIMFIRMIFSDISTKEEFLPILPMKGTTREEDIFTTFITFTL